MITLWHNPRCSKSRQALALIKDHAGVTADIAVRHYLEDAPSLQELAHVQTLLGVCAIDMMRPSETRFKQLGLSKNDADATLLAAMVADPILIERPIVLANGKAAIGRPPQNVLKTL